MECVYETTESFIRAVGFSNQQPIWAKDVLWSKWDVMGNEVVNQWRSFKLYYMKKPLKHSFPPLRHMVSIWWRSRIEDQIPALKKQTFSYVAMSDLDKIHTSHKYIRHGSSMMFADVCAASCDQHVKRIGRPTKRCQCCVSLSFPLQRSPKRSLRSQAKLMGWRSEFEMC